MPLNQLSTVDHGENCFNRHSQTCERCKITLFLGLLLALSRLKSLTHITFGVNKVLSHTVYKEKVLFLNLYSHEEHGAKFY